MAEPVTKVVTATWDDPEVFGCGGYRAAGGYEGLRAAIGMSAAEVIDVVKS